MRKTEFRDYCKSHNINVGVARRLVKLGILENTTESLSNALSLKNEFFVLCPICNIYQGDLRGAHLKLHNLTPDEFNNLYPECELVSKLSHKRRERSDELKLKQSETLKKRFQTEEGELTRKQISLSMKRYFETNKDYKDKVSSFLRTLNKDPNQRALCKARSLALHKNPEHKAKIRAYVDANYAELCTSIARARSFRKTTSTVHLKVFDLLKLLPGSNFVLEAQVGYFILDNLDTARKAVVEVNGCYWHSCALCKLEGPKSNILRDKKKATYLKNKGYNLLVVWEHELKDIEALTCKLNLWWNGVLNA